MKSAHRSVFEQSFRPAHRARLSAAVAVICALPLAGPLRGQNGWTVGSGTITATPSTYNVGIGTASPGSAYNGVNSVASSPVLDLKSANASHATLLRLISAPTSPGSYFAGIEFDANDTGNANQAYNVGRIYGIFDYGLWSQGRLTFSTPTGPGGWVDTMSLKNGNVGIGTTNPSYPLSVNGTILAKEVIVQTGWSDYVFAPDYSLTPLPDLAAYIERNHHLPDIPSQAEVTASGVSLGAMQSKLLAKIEELTLHMIQAEQRNRELEQRLVRLESGSATGRPDR